MERMTSGIISEEPLWSSDSKRRCGSEGGGALLLVLAGCILCYGLGIWERGWSGGGVWGGLVEQSCYYRACTGARRYKKKKKKKREYGSWRNRFHRRLICRLIQWESTPAAPCPSSFWRASHVPGAVVTGGRRAGRDDAPPCTSGFARPPK